MLSSSQNSASCCFPPACQTSLMFSQSWSWGFQESLDTHRKLLLWSTSGNLKSKVYHNIRDSFFLIHILCIFQKTFCRASSYLHDLLSSAPNSHSEKKKGKWLVYVRLFTQNHMSKSHFSLFTCFQTLLLKLIRES
jgi:hypothetical protein